MDIGNLVTFVTEIAALLGVIIPIFRAIKRISDGQKCQLRSEMLRIYYHSAHDKTLRQYEYENFVALYNAYKALGGNSFIDKIYEEIKKWTVVP